MTRPANDIVVETLRLRGAHGRRLARVAARALPAALDRALADVGDVAVASVQVLLDLDPEEYDDETLAVLWADLVRAELVALSPGRDPAAGVPSSADPPPPGRPAPAGDVAAAARAWSAAAATGDAPLPATLLALGDPGTAALVAARLGPVEWQRLVRALARALRLRGGGPTGARDDVPEGHADRRGPTARDDAWRPAARESRVPSAGPGPAPGADEHGPAAPAVPPRPAGPTGTSGDPLEALRVLAGLRSDPAAPLEPTTITRCAGLVLLYPWLAEHCRLAEELHPTLDPVPVRAAALAAVLGEPHHADDPLVGLLAGRPVPVADDVVARVPLARAAEVAASADGVLASFAALLPGFERSTPGFVRDGWLLRDGLLDTGRDPALLTGATRPLDVLLPLLPYPLGLLKLPWSPPLSVRFRP